MPSKLGNDVVLGYYNVMRRKINSAFIMRWVVNSKHYYVKDCGLLLYNRKDVVRYNEKDV